MKKVVEDFNSILIKNIILYPKVSPNSVVKILTSECVGNFYSTFLVYCERFVIRFYLEFLGDNLFYDNLCVKLLTRFIVLCKHLM